MGSPEVAHMGPQQGSRALLGVITGLGELKQSEDRPEEGQRRGLRVETAPELADADEPGEDLDLEGDGLLDPVVAQSASDLGIAALADDEQTPPYTPP